MDSKHFIKATLYAPLVKVLCNILPKIICRTQKLSFLIIVPRDISIITLKSTYYATTYLLEYFSLAQNVLILLRRGKKNYMVLVPARTTFASRTAHFFIFLFHFFLSLIRSKATVCGKKIRYLIVITLFALYDKKWRPFPL